MPNRRIIVYAGASADGFIARPDGDIEWLTSRPAPQGFYDIDKFTASIDTRILGRKTYEKSLVLGLLSTRQFTDGVVQLHYEVQPPVFAPGA